VTFAHTITLPHLIIVYNYQIKYELLLYIVFLTMVWSSDA